MNKNLYESKVKESFYEMRNQIYNGFKVGFAGLFLGVAITVSSLDNYIKKTNDLNFSESSPIEKKEELLSDLNKRMDYSQILSFGSLFYILGAGATSINTHRRRKKSLEKELNSSN